MSRYKHAKATNSSLYEVVRGARRPFMIARGDASTTSPRLRGEKKTRFLLPTRGEETRQRRLNDVVLVFIFFFFIIYILNGKPERTAQYTRTVLYRAKHDTLVWCKIANLARLYHQDKEINENLIPTDTKYTIPTGRILVHDWTGKCWSVHASLGSI